MNELSPLSAVRSSPDLNSKTDEPVMRAAIELEGAFISEMLKSAGFGAARDAFGGGQGEEQFSSFLRDRQARGIAEAGGFGLAEAIYRSMVARQTDV